MVVTVKNILERIEAAGLPQRWVRYNIFPHWWDKDCDEAANRDGTMMAIIEVELMRVLGVEIEALRDEDAELEFKLDYAPKALTDMLKPKGDPPVVGRLVTNSGAVTGVR